MDYDKLAEFVESLLKTVGAQINVIRYLEEELRKAKRRIQDLEAAPTEWVKKES